MEIILQLKCEDRSEEHFTEDTYKALQISYQEERLFTEHTIQKASFILVELECSTSLKAWTGA